VSSGLLTPWSCESRLPVALFLCESRLAVALFWFENRLVVVLFNHLTAAFLCVIKTCGTNAYVATMSSNWPVDSTGKVIFKPFRRYGDGKSLSLSIRPLSDVSRRNTGY